MALLLHAGFSVFGEQGLLSGFRGRAFYCGSFSCPGRAPRLVLSRRGAPVAVACGL